MTTHAPARAPLGPASLLAAALAALTGASPALAQDPTGDARAFITINGGLQAMTSGFSENIVFRESGNLYPTGSSPTPRPANRRGSRAATASRTPRSST